MKKILIFATFLCAPFLANAQDFTSADKVPPTQAMGIRASALGKTVHKSSRNEDIDLAAAESVNSIGGLFDWVEFDGGAITIDVVSSSANDAAAGTGARTVVLEGLDANFLEISETLTLNGVTAVTSTSSFIRVNHAYVASAGTGGENAGTITFQTAGAQALLGIDPGKNQVYSSNYTVPDNFAGCVRNIYTSTNGTSSSVDIVVSLFIRDNGGVFREQEHFDMAGSENLVINDYECIPVAARSDIDFRANSDTDNSIVDVSYQLNLYRIRQ